MVTSLRLTRDEHARLKVIAASEHRSLSGQLRYMIDMYFSELEKAKAA